MSESVGLTPDAATKPRTCRMPVGSGFSPTHSAALRWISSLERRHELIDLRRLDDQRRRQRDDVAGVRIRMPFSNAFTKIS